MSRGPNVVLVEDHPLHARVLRQALAVRLRGGEIELFRDGTTACRAAPAALVRT